MQIHIYSTLENSSSSSSSISINIRRVVAAVDAPGQHHDSVALLWQQQAAAEVADAGPVDAHAELHHHRAQQREPGGLEDRGEEIGAGGEHQQCLCAY